MNIFEITLLDVIFISFPILVYLVYVAYNQSFQRQENNLFLDVAIFTSFYMSVRYAEQLLDHLPLLLLHIPLIVAFVKGRRFAALILMVLLSGYYYSQFNYSIFLLILVYLGCYLIYAWKCYRHFSDRMLFNLLIGWISLAYVYFVIQDGYFMWIGDDDVLMGLYVIVAFFLMGNVLFFLFLKGEEIMMVHMNVKDLEHETQVRTSIFKITHEIKNPIAVCKGYLDMFDPNNQAHAFKYIPIIKDEIDRTLFLLQDYLSFNKVTIEKDILDIHLLLVEVLDSLKLLFRENGIACSVEVSDDEVFIDGDYNRLTQVVINIIKNSIEAMDGTRNGKVHIYTKVDDGRIEIFFEDNGMGMDEDTLKRIREPFFTTKCRGTGLGVCISDEIIVAHDGVLDYHSVYGEGTCVCISLPILSEV